MCRDSLQHALQPWQLHLAPFSSNSDVLAFCAVPALEVVRSTYKYWPINSPSISTHQRSYDKLQMVKWDLRNVEESRAVCSYVEERLESVAMTADPRTNTGTTCSIGLAVVSGASGHSIHE